MDRRAVIGAALRNGQLLRVLAAFLVFNVAWWANWIAVLVWAYNWAGVRGASGVALAQLVPSALLATPAAHLFGRWPRAVALRRGYVVQALTYALPATSLRRPLRHLGAGDWFGELALLRDAPRTATVDCSSDVRLWSLERDSFLAAVAYCPEPSRRTPDYYR